MKKILSIMLAAALALPVIAGDKPTPEERAKADYSAWLPQEGDWQIGFSLNPIATFVGNMFNGTGTNLAVGKNTLDPLAGEALGVPNMASIMGSYMITDKLGLHANIGIAVNGWNTRSYVIDDAAKFVNPYSTLEGLDTWKNLNAGASISLGAEYRVGKKRVQGVFGGGVTYGFWGLRQNKFAYYNAITVDNQNPTNANLWGAAGAGYVANAKLATDYSFLDNPRMLEKNGGAGTHILGIYGSVGVEWFVAPKIALGFNVNLLLDYQWNPSHVEVWEGWNKFTQQRQEIVIHDNAMQNGFTFTTNNIGANLYMAFYFGK